MIETDEALPPDGIQPEGAFGFVTTVVAGTWLALSGS